MDAYAQAMEATKQLVPKTQLKGREFEKLLVARHDEYRKAHLGSIGRYGVQAVHTGGERGLVALQSLPDFEGIVAKYPRQIIFDAKVCSESSWGLSKYRAETKGPRRRQLRHMYERAQFGAVCFFLIHWNPRTLKTKTEPPQTFILPVDWEAPLWQRFEAGLVRTVTRDDCYEFGEVVPWNVLGRARTARPDWLVVL